MEGKTVVELSNPPAYVMQSATSRNQRAKYSSKTRALLVYAVAVSTALIVVLILGGVYYNRTLDVLQDTIKKYSEVYENGRTPVKEDIEVDTEKNTVVFRLSGQGITPGTFALFDYTKSMTGIYDPEVRKCFLIGGIKSKIADAKTFSDSMEKNVTKPMTIETLQYKMADTYPVNDKTILPSALKSACAHLPVYWLEPDTQQKGIQKRAVCNQICVDIKLVEICYTRCRS